MLEIAVGLVAAVLIGYLFASVLRPEWF